MKAVALALVPVGLFAARTALAEPPAAPARAEGLAPSGDASVSVGVLRDQGNVRSELAGFLSVEVPLDRVAAPGRVLVATVDPSAGGDGLGEGGAYGAEPDELARSADDGDGSGVVAPALDATLLGRLARETLLAAERAGGLPGHERALDGLAGRARASATLPELRLRAARSRDESLRLAPTAEDPYRFSLAGGNGLLLEAQATFRLNRLVFADEEIPVERLRIERERLSERLRARVLARVVAWHRALSREQSAAEPEQRGRARLERIGTEAELDVLTDGWFAARVRKLPVARVERRDPGPKTPAQPQPASKSKPPGSSRVRSQDGAVARLDLEAPAASARPASSCLPKLATDSPTSCGALMR